ncbi:MAG: DEAD/DEAH box helicase [Planctomycetaceae bacterium]|nr:DEAD/DEAH box helicase [Planctomycetaceae bacterium]
MATIYVKRAPAIAVTACRRLPDLVECRRNEMLQTSLLVRLNGDTALAMGDQVAGASSNAAWMLDGDNICIRMQDGQWLYPTAMEIVGAEFKSRLNIRGAQLQEPPSLSLQEISFARFPLSVRLCLSTAGEGECSCFVEGTDADNRVPLTWPTTDQILIDGKWFPLVHEDVAAVRDALREANVPSPGQLTLRQYLAIIRQGRPQVVVDSSAEAKHCTSMVIHSIPADPGFCGTLYPYQEVGVRWLQAVTAEGLGCVLGDEMGLGKTVQIIRLLVGERPSRSQPALIVAPATLLENWRREITKFAPGLRVAIHRGQGRTGFPAQLASHDVVLISYDLAARDLSLLKMVPWNVVILDEAQAIKNPNTRRSLSVKAIGRRVGIAVTGTPVENRLRDLWSIMDFTCPGFLGTLNDFEQRFTDSTKDAILLEHIVTPLLLRRQVKDVAADLPERIDIPQAVELSAVAANEYEILRAAIVEKYGAAATLVALIKLRMFCAHPFLINQAEGDPAHYSTKYERLLELMDEIIVVGHKAIIFTSFQGMADLLRQDMSRRYRCFCEIIDGRTCVESRQPTVDAFQEYAGAGVLVLNPRAAGTGLNITAANHVIHYNLEWNPAIEDQATARAFRRGQKRPVTVHRLFHPGTVEEVIDDRVQRKRELARTAVVGTEGSRVNKADIVRALSLSPHAHGEQA